MRPVGLALLTWVAAMPFVVAQPDAEIDRTDPKAVAEAYINACREGDLELALSLLTPDERVRETVKGFTEDFDEEGAPGGLDMSMGDIFKEFQFMPIEFGIDRKVAEAVEQGDEARVTFKAAFAFDQQIVLTRQEDGTWAIDLLDSMKATTGRDASLFEEEMGPPPEEEMGPPPEEADVDAPLGPEEMQMMMEQQATVAGQPGMGGARGLPPLQRLFGATMAYVNDHDNRLPPAETWVDEIELYLLDRSLFKNPDAPELEYGYAMNAEVGGQAWEDLWADDDQPMGQLLLVEWPTGERNATATPDGLADSKSVRDDGSIAYITTTGTEGRAPAGKTFAEAVEAALDDEEVVEEMIEEGPEDDARQRYYMCRRHLSTLVQAIRRYAREHEGLLPPAETWQDDIALMLLEMGEGNPWLEAQDPADLLRCPAAPDIEFAYAINEEVAGKNALDLTDQDTLVLFFESDLNVLNAAGDPARDACTAPRHEWEAGRGEMQRANLLAYLTGRLGWDLDRTDAPGAPEADE